MAEPIVIAHRGGAALRPENTIAAFQYAIDRRVPIIEFDMNMTADGKIVIHHDSSVNASICQAAEGSGVKPGPIGQLTLASLLKFDCGSFKRVDSPRYQPVSGQRMPTLDDLLALVKNHQVTLLGETKMPSPDAAYAPDPVRFAELIEASVRKFGLESRFILESFDYRTLDAMHSRNPKIQICVLGARRFKPDYLSVARKHHATHLMLRFDDASPEQFQQLRSAGLKIFSGTSNAESEWKRYVELNVDAILTDDPIGLARYLKLKNSH